MSPRRLEYRPDVSYAQAHLRLKIDRGRPREYECVSCGAQAREWAYMGGCPDERTERGRKYSVDQSRYAPMCVSCHRRQDRASVDGRTVEYCPRGHEWTYENTGIRVKRAASSGFRFCRACHRENTRAYRARIRSSVSA